VTDEPLRRRGRAAAVADDVAQERFVDHVEHLCALPDQFVGERLEGRDDRRRRVDERDLFSHQLSLFSTVPKKSVRPDLPALERDLDAVGGRAGRGRAAERRAGVSSPIISSESMPSARATSPDVSPPAD
jgi:hypothetical protein